MSPYSHVTTYTFPHAVAVNKRAQHFGGNPTTACSLTLLNPLIPTSYSTGLPPTERCTGNVQIAGPRAVVVLHAYLLPFPSTYLPKLLYKHTHSSHYCTTRYERRMPRPFRFPRRWVGTSMPTTTTSRPSVSTAPSARTSLAGTTTALPGMYY